MTRYNMLTGLRAKRAPRTAGLEKTLEDDVDNLFANHDKTAITDPGYFDHHHASVISFTCQTHRGRATFNVQAHGFVNLCISASRKHRLTFEAQYVTDIPDFFLNHQTSNSYVRRLRPAPLQLQTLRLLHPRRSWQTRHYSIL